MILTTTVPKYTGTGLYDAAKVFRSHTVIPATPAIPVNTAQRCAENGCKNAVEGAVQ